MRSTPRSVCCRWCRVRRRAWTRCAIRRRFDQENAPRDLTLIHATGLGDRDSCGTDLLAVPGLVKRDIAGHLAMAPKMGKLISDNVVECYNFPQGVISHLFGAIGGRKPGVFTKVGS